MAGEPIPESLKDLGDVIRKIERETGEPAQLIVKVIDSNYVIGDFRKRQGEYGVIIWDGQYSQLEGKYKNFEDIYHAVKHFNKFDKTPHITGSLVNGFSISIEGDRGLGSGGGQGCLDIGTIKTPLIELDEEVLIQRVDSVD